MVNNLAEKVDKAKLEPLSVFCTQLGVQKVFVSSDVSTNQGLLKYWSEWKNSQDALYNFV